MSVSTVMPRSSKQRDERGLLQQRQASGTEMPGPDRHTAAAEEVLLMGANVLLKCRSCTGSSQNQSPSD